MAGYSITLTAGGNKALRSGAGVSTLLEMMNDEPFAKYLTRWVYYREEL